MAIFKKHVLKQAIEGGQEKIKIMSIFNKYKNTLKNLVDRLDIEFLAILRSINLLSNDIPYSKDNPSDPKLNNYFLNKLQGQQQFWDTFLLF